MLVVLSIASVLLSAPPIGKRVHPVEVTASSSLLTSWNKFEENYLPPYAADDDVKTAWVEGADGDGKGEWLDLQFLPVGAARSATLLIANGYQKSKGLLDANAAPRSVTVIVFGAGGEESGRATAVLERTMGKQAVTVAPLSGGVARVRIVVDEVTAGGTYKDLCISDVQVFVDTDAVIDAKAQDAQHAKLLAWKAERVAAAKFFAKTPPTYPFAARDFVNKAPKAPLSMERVDVVDWGATPRLKDPKRWSLGALLDANDPSLRALSGEERAVLREVLALRAASAPPAGVSVRRVEPRLRPRGTNGQIERMRLPGGFAALEPLTELLSLSDVTFAEPSSDKPNRIVTLYIAPAKWERHVLELGNAWLWRRADASIERMFLSVREVEHEGDSGTFSSVSHWLLDYDASGRLMKAARVQVHDAIWFGIAHEGFGLYGLTRRADGKIDGMRGKSARVSVDLEHGRRAHHVVAAVELAPAQ